MAQDVIERALNFPAIVVESKVRTWDDGGESWEQTFYNMNNQSFVTDRISVVDEEGSRFVNSNHFKRVLGFKNIGIAAYGKLQDYVGIYEGVYVTLKAEISSGKLQNGDPWTAVHYLPIKLEARSVGEEELARLKGELQAQRDKNQTGKSVSVRTTPTSTFTTEEIESMVAYLDGRAEGDFEDIRTLDTRLANAIRNGEGVMFLIGQGFLDRSDDGTYTRT